MLTRDRRSPTAITIAQPRIVSIGDSFGAGVKLVDTIVIVSLISLLSLVSLRRPPFHFSCGWQRAEHMWSKERESTLHPVVLVPFIKGAGPLKHMSRTNHGSARNGSARESGRTGEPIHSHSLGRVPFPLLLCLCFPALTLFHPNETFPRHVFGYIKIVYTAYPLYGHFCRQ